MSRNRKLNLNSGGPPSILTEADSESQYLTTLPDGCQLRFLKNSPLYWLINELPLAHPRFVPFCKLILKQNHRLLLYIGDLESIRKFKCSFRIGIPFANYLVDTDGKDRSYEPKFYLVHYVTLDDETVHKLVTLMPAISHLEIVISQVNIYVISRLIRLLTHWASTLKLLKFCCGDFQPEDSQYLRTLICEINSKLSFLEHLTLDLDGELLGKYEIIDHKIRWGSDCLKSDMPILSRLKEFFFQTRDRLYYLKMFWDIVERQAGEQLTAIGFGLPFTWDQYRSDLVNHPLAARLKLLAIQYEPPLTPTCLPNLQGYITHWHLNQSLNSVISPLFNLQYLQYLELCRLPHYEKVSGDAFALSPLPSVEILRINFINPFNLANDHTVLQDAHWAYIFPSVQIVNLIHLGHFCAKCYPKEDNYRSNASGFEATGGRMSCLSHLLAPLTLLPSLRKIFYQRNNDLKNIAEFTGKGKFVKTHAYIY